jgi:tetratricopeptide (TPR) repeat protein
MPSSSTRWLAAAVFVLASWGAWPAGAAQYVVEGFSLGAAVSANPDYRSYACKPSADFAGMTECQRSQQRGTSVAVSTILHKTADGTAVYLMVKAAPVKLSRSAVLSEIANLARQFNAQPVAVEWLPQRQGLPSAVVARWGDIRLEELKWDAVEIVAAGNNPRMGALVDFLGDPKRSADAGLPIYRITGAAGYLYSASFDATGTGYRFYLALDATALAISQYELKLGEILRNDAQLRNDDYQLWPQVAEVTRNVARETSAKIADDALDRVFDGAPRKKLRSHVWSHLPGGAIEHLAQHQHWRVDILGPSTGFPAIRRDIQSFLAANPAEPFIEFLHYVIGEYDQALQANSNSIISDVLHYASGYRSLELLLQEAAAAIHARPEDIKEKGECFSDTIRTYCILKFLNMNPDYYQRRLLATVVPTFAQRAAAARPHFEAVLHNAASPHADDAAYMLGWLAFHQDRTPEALSFFSKAMAAGNGDYKQPQAMRQTVRILQGFPPDQQASTVAANDVFSHQPALWYVAARSAYREFNYGLAAKTGERALQALDIPIAILPVTTDAKRIEQALENINPELLYNPNVEEIPYVLYASEDIRRYESYLTSAAAGGPDDVSKQARAIIMRYSMLLDEDPQKQSATAPAANELKHKDLRQALHLIDVTLASTPKNAQYSALREWLYYRKARVAAVFAPQTTRAVVASMEQEFPTSRLFPNALAEELYAEAVMLRDLTAAEATFAKLVNNFRTSNAVDNAYTWMAIIYRCEGRSADAQRMNRDIIRLFPTTRHARYARERMADPSASACGLGRQ